MSIFRYTRPMACAPDRPPSPPHARPRPRPPLIAAAATTEEIFHPARAHATRTAAREEAREFIADELEVRSASFGTDEPEHSDYIAPAQRLLVTIKAALGRVEG